MQHKSCECQSFQNETKNARVQATSHMSFCIRINMKNYVFHGLLAVCPPGHVVTTHPRHHRFFLMVHSVPSLLPFLLKVEVPVPPLSLSFQVQAQRYLPIHHVLFPCIFWPPHQQLHQELAHLLWIEFSFLSLHRRAHNVYFLPECLQHVTLGMSVGM